MKLAIINDSHFGVRGDSRVFLDHQEKFFSEIFFPYIDQHGIKVVLDLGDTFDRRKFINYVTLSRAKTFFFDEMAKRGIQYHAIVGNHSVYYTNTNHVNSLSLLLKEYENFRFYEHEPTNLTFGTLDITMVPWITKDNADVCYRAISDTKSSILMGHFEIKGFEVMRGQLCDHGMDKELLSNFDAVYSGHFHHPSEYGNIKYLGAQYEMTWTDYAGKRGFHVLDTETRDLMWIENPHRVFHKIEYDDTEMTVDDIASLDTSALKDTYIKVIVKNRTNAYIHDLFLSKLSDSGAADVKSIDDSLNLESSGVEEILDESQDTKQILHNYVDSVETKVNRKHIKRLVDDLYTEALNVT